MYIVCVRACVRACACVRARACVRAYVCERLRKEGVITTNIPRPVNCKGHISNETKSTFDRPELKFKAHNTVSRGQGINTDE